MEEAAMESNKSNGNYGSPDDQRGSGEPGFVFTDYDRGAPRSNKDDSLRDEETAETESQRPQN